MSDQRKRMVEEQLRARGIRDPRVLEAMGRVPRHDFVPVEFQAQAYADQPVPIGHDQTISQPYIVAIMSELAAIQPSDRVLEVGTGSGYQAAILACLTDHVYSIEILEPLATQAAQTLGRLGYSVQVRAGDGFQGWPEAAPFNAIIVTAAAPYPPQPLLDQLAKGGRLVIPLGSADQELVVFTRNDQGFSRASVIPVRFVPMTGQVRESERN
jgi:protein-L-isoaspartate(D-aspartate) O-methyltransferase